MKRILLAVICMLFMTNANAYWYIVTNTDNECDVKSIQTSLKAAKAAGSIYTVYKTNVAFKEKLNDLVIKCGETLTPEPEPDPDPTPEPVNHTPTLDATPYASLFSATPQADRIKFETVLASLDAQTLLDVQNMTTGFNVDQQAVFVAGANTVLAAAAVPTTPAEIESLGNELAKHILIASGYIKPVETCPAGYEGTPPNCVPIVVVDTPPHTGHGNGHMPEVDSSLNMKPAVGYSEMRLKPETYTPAPVGGSSTGGDFRIECLQNKMSEDDPIVFKNKKGAAHHHSFFGNTDIDFSSTTDSLKKSGNSTCKGGIANRSAYWVPSLIYTPQNKPIKADWALFYYKGGDITPPNGLVIIAGDQTASPAKPQSLNVIDWQCHVNGSTDTSYAEYLARKPHIIPCSHDLTATVKFPACWNGVDLDSPDHKSHMSYYNESGRCPASHPKNIPDITYAIHYNVSSTEGLRLSSDDYVGGAGGYSFHGDYMFAWDDDVLEVWFANCNGKDRDCHANLLGNGKELY